MNNKGYYDSSKWINTRGTPPRSEEPTVICNYCNSTWKEEMPSKALIAGYARRYDFCSLCEARYFKAKGQIPMRANIGIHPSNTDPQPDKYSNKFKTPKWANPKLGHEGPINPNNPPTDPNSLWGDSANGEII